MRTTILFEDRDIIVAYKPAGLATQTAAVGQADMVSELKNHLQGAYLGVVHRLDQPVEGVLAFGKTKNATAGLAKQLAGGILNKHYYCVICGQISSAEGRLSDYLYKNRENRAEIVSEGQAREKQARSAVLQYRILEILPDVVQKEGIALARICLETGRFHQIRAQMAHAGMPLLGDRKYGDQRSEAISEKLCVKTVALCAYELQLEHPVQKKKLCFRIEPKAEIFHRFTQMNDTETVEK